MRWRVRTDVGTYAQRHAVHQSLAEARICPSRRTLLSARTKGSQVAVRMKRRQHRLR